MQIGTKVEFTGDRIGDNTALTIPENVGKQGIIKTHYADDFWWVLLDDDVLILACESELKELNELP